MGNYRRLKWMRHRICFRHRTRTAIFWAWNRAIESIKYHFLKKELCWRNRQLWAPRQYFAIIKIFEGNLIDIIPSWATLTAALTESTIVESIQQLKQELGWKKKNPGKINKRNDEIFIFEWMSTGSWKIVKRTWWIRAPMMHLTWRRLWPLNRGNPHRIIDIIEYLKQELCWKYPQLSFGCQWNSNHETMRVNSIELKLTAGLIGLPASDIISNCLHMPFYIEM